VRLEPPTGCLDSLSLWVDLLCFVFFFCVSSHTAVHKCK